MEDFKIIKLKNPIKDGKDVEITEIKINAPTAGQVKFLKLSDLSDISFESLLKITAECSSLTERVLDKLSTTDMLNVCQEMTSFLFPGTTAAE